MTAKYAAHMLRVSLFDLHFHPEDGDIAFLCSVGNTYPTTRRQLSEDNIFILVIQILYFYKYYTFGHYQLSYFYMVF
jgi:hypothetical protein